MPTQVLRDLDQTWAGQQQCPCVSSLTAFPGGQPATQDSPWAFIPAGQVGIPTQTSRALDQA